MTMCWRIPEDLRAAVLATQQPTFPRLSPRLAALALAVPEGARVADVGADHGLLGAALLSAGRAAHVTAIDISPLALAGAARSLALHVVAGRARVVPGDGLAPVEVGSVDCVVLAGMGGPAAGAILEEAFARGHRPRRLVVQASTGEAALRERLVTAGYGVVAEELCAEGERCFLTLTFDAEGGVRRLDDDVARYVGPLLSRRRDPATLAWLEVQRAWLTARVSALCAATARRATLAGVDGAVSVTARNELDVARARLAAILACAP